MSPHPNAHKEERLAIAVASFGHLAGGVAPLLFKAVAAAGMLAWETTAQRCVWSFVFVALLCWRSRQGEVILGALRDRHTMGWLLLSTGLMSSNWMVSTWAAQNSRILDLSLGFYLVPLVNMASGALFFRERSRPLEIAAMVLAAIGVVVQSMVIGRVPLISVAIALQFGGYSVVRKHVRIDGQPGVAIELGLMLLPALAFLAWVESQGVGHSGDLDAMLPLLAAAAISSVTLAGYSWSTRRMSLATVGFVQFLAPTAQFIAALAAGERLSLMRLASFGFVWAGVFLFGWGVWGRYRLAAAATNAAPPT